MTASKKFYISIVVTLLYLSALFSLHDSLNSVALYALLPGAFFLTTFQKESFKVNIFFGILMMLYLWILYVTPFSTNLTFSNIQLKQLVGCVIVSYIIVVQSNNEKTIPWLYIIYIIIYVVSIDYTINNILNTMELGEDRASDEKLNANQLAYYTFYVTFVLFMLGEIITYKWLRILFRILFFGIIPMSLWIAYITASRQVLIIEVPLIAILLFLRYWTYASRNSRIIFVVLLCCIAPILLKSVSSIFQESLLVERSEDIGDDTRLELISETIDIGLKNPLVGVGPGCVRLYTSERAFAHNTFLELFASTGVIGMTLFILLLWKFIARQIKRYIAYKDKMYMYFLIFGIFFTIDQVFYVFYQAMYLISFFILVASHSEIYYNNRKHLII